VIGPRSVPGISGLAAIGGAILCGGAAAAAVLAGGSRVDRSIHRRLHLPRGGSTTTGTARRVAMAVGRNRWVHTIARGRRAAGLLDAARLPLDPALFVGSKGLASIALAGVAVMAPAPGPALAPVLAAAPLFAPDIALARIAGRRRRRIEAQLPQFLDLLAAGSTAGLSALVALRRAASSLTDPLAEELRTLLARVDLGARWRPELRALAARLDLPDLNRAVMAMARTETLGTPLAESLRHRADEVRESRRARAAERARKAPVKMLFPLVFMILPAFLLLTVVPVLVSTLRSVR
jgi:tight adherence protein C